MEVREMGEFGLIERLRKAIGTPAGARLVAGIGDDAAVWRQGPSYVVATTDTMVAGVHFLPEGADWRDVGWKAMASNVSDIAAMGATPGFALVTLCLPASMPIDAIDRLYDGLRACGDEFGVTIAGGDVVSSPVFAVTVALLGEAAAAKGGTPVLLRRGTAHAGDAARGNDAIAVTGALGGAAGGLRVLLADEAQDKPRRALVERHTRPQPRLKAAQEAVAAGIRCGIDISDGLVQDLGHVCEASGVGAEIMAGAVPVDPALTAVFPDDALMMALSGGEDYELVLVGPEEALRKLDGAASVPVTVIGRIVDDAAKRVRVLDAAGAEIPVAQGGWDHLSRPGA
jgi:thiamine-monophosphate kinase